MAHSRQELAFGPVGFIGALFRATQIIEQLSPLTDVDPASYDALHFLEDRRVGAGLHAQLSIRVYRRHRGIRPGCYCLQGLKLDSGAGRHIGGSMFPNDGDKAADQWGRVGATAKMRFSKTELRYGTLQPKLPILVSNVGCLLPQTFEGGQVTSNEIDNLTFTAGQLEHAAGRASSDSAGLAVAGGTQESNKFTFASGDYKLTKDLTAQYYYANREDYYQQHFTGLLHVLPLGEYGSLKTDLRYFKTTSDGKNSSAVSRASGCKFGGYTTGGVGEIDNDTWSGAFIYSLGVHTITAGYQSVSDDSNFAQLNQGGLVDKGEAGASLYLYTDRTIQTFIQSGERTAFAQYAYDFAALGAPGLKVSVMYLTWKVQDWRYGK